MSALTNSLPFLITIILAKGGQKIGLLRKSFKAPISALLFNLVLPALIIASLQDVPVSLGDLKLTLLALAAWVLFGLVGFTYTKILKLSRSQSGTVIIGFLSLNIGAMVYPLIELNYSRQVLTKVIFYNAFGNSLLLFILTQSIAVFYGEKGKLNYQAILKKIFSSPVFIALLIAIFSSIFGLKYPQIINQVINYIASSLGFLAAVLLALNLKMPPKKETLTALTASVLKLTSGITIGFLLTWLFGISGDIRKGLIVATSAPVAMVTLVFATMAKLDTKLLSQFISWTLILSLFALPLLMALL